MVCTLYQRVYAVTNSESPQVGSRLGIMVDRFDHRGRHRYWRAICHVSWRHIVYCVETETKDVVSRFTQHEHSLQGVTAVWLQPSVATIVSAATGSIVADYLDPSRARLTVVVSYIIWGLGFLPAILIMSSYFLRLAVHKVSLRYLILARHRYLSIWSLSVSTQRSGSFELSAPWTLRPRWICALEVEHGCEKAVSAVRRNRIIFEARSADIWKCGLCWNDPVSCRWDVGQDYD